MFLVGPKVFSFVVKGVKVEEFKGGGVYYRILWGDLIIIIRNGAKTISLQTTFGRLNNNNINKKRSKNNKSPNNVWET
jgi:hypothetical protein